jgi:hypothetical protein
LVTLSSAWNREGEGMKKKRSCRERSRSENSERKS